MQKGRKKQIKAVFTFRICHLLPPHWQSSAIMLAKPCHRSGKVLPMQWQKIDNSLKVHCSVGLVTKIL
ncbi:hypothetical protein DW712_10485 [Bacteroides intestinalis]|uniref:Uncharacterized protein n=1 Tax=Bacteroides intestinalis TaxID=329854 RepID=A0A414LBQ1_9BACE|nr:hypothetical protein DW712_10485 [Bacteroides intestinalis]